MSSSTPPPDGNNGNSSSSSWSALLPSTWVERWNTFNDDQRVERLHICRQLEKVLDSCRHQNDKNPMAIENLSPGLRVMKYFKWRGILKDLEEEQDNPETSSRFSQAIQNSCAREQHAVWACRAVATGCGQDLSALKSCFESEGAYTVLVHPSTKYDNKIGDNTNNVVPCQEFQQNLGACVTKGAQDLLQRRQQRRTNGGGETAEECH